MNYSCFKVAAYAIVRIATLLSKVSSKRTALMLT